MKKRRFIAVLSAAMMICTLLIETTTFAGNFTGPGSEWSHDFPDESSWDKFIKYDLCITDYDSLTDEEKELCRYIFETEINSKYICERARRTLAHDENIGERITVEKLKNSYGIWDNYFDWNIGYMDYTHCVPDLTSRNPWDEHIYWLDDLGESYVKFQPIKPYATVVENDEETVVELKAMPYFDDVTMVTTGEYENENYINVDGLYFYIYPDDTAVLISSKYKHFREPATEPINEPLIIPETVQGYPVTGIYTGAFEHSGLTEVVLPETIVTIDGGAFYECKYLEKINFPKSLKMIGEEAFYNCNLKTLDIENPELVMLYRSFSFNRNLESVKLNVHKIPFEAFIGCENLETLELGSSLYKIGENAFYNCPKLENIQLPSSLKIIGVEAFSSVKSINIPPNVEIIGALPRKNGYIRYPLIYEFDPVFDSDCTINGWYGTEAHSYAIENNLKFNPMDELLYGDANGDNEIGISDAVAIQNYLLSDGDVGYEADLNKDGRIDSFDMIAMRKMLIEN